MMYGMGRLLYPCLAEDIGEIFGKFGFELAGIKTEWMPKLEQPAIQATYFKDIPLKNGRIEVNFLNIYAPLTHKEYKRITLDEKVHQKVLNSFEEQLIQIIKREREEARNKVFCRR